MHLMVRIIEKPGRVSSPSIAKHTECCDFLNSPELRGRISQKDVILAVIEQRVLVSAVLGRLVVASTQSDSISGGGWVVSKHRP